ncbi:hypothetical protein WJX82_005611 [Trebouxia sp. C0006]
MLNASGCPARGVTFLLQLIRHDLAVGRAVAHPSSSTETSPDGADQSLGDPFKRLVTQSALFGRGRASAASRRGHLGIDV